MNQNIKELLDEFNNDLLEIFGDNIIDIVIHGSVADESFVQGKGDVDFIVLVEGNISDENFEKIKSYHRNIRKEHSLKQQLEGCYLILNKMKTFTKEGIYIGTGEKGWRRFHEDIFSNIDKAHISEKHIALKSTQYIHQIFKYNWNEVNRELINQLKTNLEIVDKYHDYDFKLHILHTTARSIYTLENKGFISKLDSLEWLLSNQNYIEYHGFIESVKKFKSPLSINENQAISDVNFEQLNGLLNKVVETL